MRHMPDDRDTRAFGQPGRPVHAANFAPLARVLLVQAMRKAALLGGSLMIAVTVALKAFGGEAGHVPVLQSASAPQGFQGVCARMPWVCATSGGTAQLDASALPLLRQVNLAVNRRTIQITDQRQYGRPEFWARPTARGGDCEDLALEKKYRLLAAGIAPAHLLIATVLDRQGGSHAVLVVRTTAGDYILDSLTDRFVTWDRTGYTFLRMQDPRRAGAWNAVLVKARPALS